MSNTIKLKRGSGSDPSASDLVVGEVALRTDSGKLFTKKDDNSVSEIGGGSGAIDDGAITNAKVASDAAIAGTKISPDFGSQNIVTTGHIDFPDDAKLKLGDSDDFEIFHQSSNGNSIIKETGGGPLSIQTNGANITFYDITNSRYMAQFITGGSCTFRHAADIRLQTTSGGATVTGNLAVTGTVDGRDIATDGTKLDGIESNATADQSNSEIKTAYEANSDTNAFTDALLSKLNGIASSATNVTNNNQLTNGAGYITATLTNEQVQDIVGGMVSSNTESGITVTYQDSDGTLDFSVASQTDNNFTDTLLSKLNGIASGATNVTNNNQLTNGAGYTDDQTQAEIDALNINADRVDGLHASSFLRSDTGDTASGDITFTGGAGAATIAGDSDIRFTNGDWTGESCKIQHHGNSLYIQGGSSTDQNIIFRSTSGTDRWRMATDGTFYPAADGSTQLGGTSNRLGNVYVGDGIYIGGTGSANKLDDFEEGDWTPSLRGGSNGAGGYSIRDGSYVKIGRLVHVNFGIAITSKGSMSGDLNVGSLPFTIQHLISDTSIEASGICGYWKHVSPNSSHLTLVAEQDSNIFVRHTVGAEDDPDQMQASDIDSDFTIRGSITYYTSQN